VAVGPHAGRDGRLFPRRRAGPPREIFSVAAVVFLPPTLIASIYGMNFYTRPELDWLFGFPFAIGLMTLFAASPYLNFKRKGWL
jgi:magnesium transporter